MFFRNLVKLLAVAFLVTMSNPVTYAGNDLDGVPDATDLDDDNDGILDTFEGLCSKSDTLNSSGYSLNTALQNTPGLPLTFYDGQVTFGATLNGTAAWTGGIQIKTDATVGDHIFVQPNNANNYFTSGNNATYTFSFSEPVENLTINAGGLNNDDGTTITAFIGGVANTIGASNFSNLSPGMTVQSNNATNDTVASTNTSGGIEVLSNTYTLTIPGPVDSVVIETGKTDGVTSNVTLGFSTLSWDCISLDTDLDGIPDYFDTDSDGDGCADANEAYAANDTDTNGDGTYGGVVGSGDVNANGTVIGASYAAPATTGGESTFQEGITLSIDADPSQQNFTVGGTADFTATVSSATVVNDPVVTTSTLVNYQWQVSTDGGTTFNNVSGGSGGNGSTSSGSTITYTTPTLALGDEDNLYRVVATNAANICGSTSATADFNAPFADLSITKDDSQTTYTPGAAFSYEIIITNNGPDAADGAVFTDNVPAWGESVTWTCSSAGAAVCPNAAGSGNAISQAIATLPNGGVLTYTVTGFYSTNMAIYPP